jgi:hypothetical protein
MPEKRGLITLAIGKKYAVQAKYLAYSCMIHAPHVLRAAITDVPERLSSLYDFIIPFDKNTGDPFSVKTQLHTYTPFEQTLFLDADSLLIGNIDSYWQFLKSRPFVYYSNLITRGNWYTNIAELIEKINIPWIPQINSGMLLFNNCEETKNIFDTAYYYSVNGKKENIDIPFFRGKMLPDEPFLAIALVKHDIKPVEDHGRFSRTLINAEKVHINVIKGIASFQKEGKPVFPLVVHFCGRFGAFFYFFERIKIFWHFISPLQCISNHLLLMGKKLFK